MRAFYRLFRNDANISDTLKLISTNNIKKLEDIRVYGHYHRLSDFLSLLNDSPDGFEIPVTNQSEMLLAQNGELEEDWQYFINPYNFRGKWNLDTDKKIKIACFGDSFTFGDGIKQEDTYIERIREMIPAAELYNVGRGGASFERVVRTFAAFVKCVDIDIAVFTFPHIHREFFIDDSALAVDLIPNPHQKNAHWNYMLPFFELHENYQKTKLSFGVNYIFDISDILGIKVLFTSWDTPTYGLLKICAPEHTANKIFPNNLDNKMARDKQHPGPKSQLRHAKHIRKEIYDRAWIQRPA
jgi:hypothetical protein